MVIEMLKVFLFQLSQGYTFHDRAITAFFTKLYDVIILRVPLKIHKVNFITKETVFLYVIRRFYKKINNDVNFVLLSSKW